jgi:hypothetical protein
MSAYAITVPHIGAHLIVNVETIKPKILDKANRRVHEISTIGFSRQRSREIRRISPPANRKQDLQIAVGFLQEIELLNAAVGIIAAFAPGVIWIVLFKIGVRIGQEDLAGISLEIGERIQHMCDRCNRVAQVLWLKVASIDSLFESTISNCKSKHASAWLTHPVHIVRHRTIATVSFFHVRRSRRSGSGSCQRNDKTEQNRPLEKLHRESSKAESQRNVCLL